MVKLSEKDKEALLDIFAPSKYSISINDDINQDNYDNYIQYEYGTIETENNGVSKAVYFPKAFPNIVVKIPLTSGPEEKYWFSNGSYYTADGDATARHTQYEYEWRGERFSCTSDSIPSYLDIELKYDWNYCEIEEVLFKEAKKKGVGKFFAQTILIGDVNGYPVYVQERGRVFDLRDERPLSEKEKREGYQRQYSDIFTMEMQTNYWHELIDIYKEYCKENHCRCRDYMLRQLPDMWLVDFYLYWGAKNLHKLLVFLDEYYIDDFHNENVGYINHIPVIIDYSSFHS